MSFFRSLFVAVLLLATLIHESASFKRFAGRVQRVAVKRTTVLMAGFGAPKKDVRQQAVDPLRPCACGSGFNYGECCQPYHLGKAFAPNPVKAVRARFSALVYKILPYMIATTHPSHKEYVAPEQKSKMKSWEKDLQTFADEYKFISIAFDDEDRDSKPEGDIATVSFKAKLQREGYDRPPETMEENSKFILTDGKWLYAGKTYRLCYNVFFSFYAAEEK
jgi:SEC-C motif-containing protein